MPFLVRILEEDLGGWVLAYEPDDTGRTHYTYRPAQRLGRINLRSPAPLRSFIDELMFCSINTLKSRREVSTEIALEQLNRKISGSPRILRLKIERVEPGTPLRVILAEL
jgi:hypothetical protein